MTKNRNENVPSLTEDLSIKSKKDFSMPKSPVLSIRRGSKREAEIEREEEGVDGGRIKEKKAKTSNQSSIAQVCG